MAVNVGIGGEVQRPLANSGDRWRYQQRVIDAGDFAAALHNVLRRTGD